jgi:hypothetical protein
MKNKLEGENLSDMLTRERERENGVFFNLEFTCSKKFAGGHVQNISRLLVATRTQIGASPLGDVLRKNVRGEHEPRCFLSIFSPAALFRVCARERVCLMFVLGGGIVLIFSSCIP